MKFEKKRKSECMKWGRGVVLRLWEWYNLSAYKMNADIFWGKWKCRQKCRWKFFYIWENDIKVVENNKILGKKIGKSYKNQGKWV